MRLSPCIFAALLSACGSDLTPNIDLTQPPPDLLSEMGLMAWDGNAPVYAEGVHPYTLNTPLFSDYAVKDRAVYLPEGTSAVPGGAADVLDFPVGTVILKTFSFPADLRSPTEAVDPKETRLLRRTDEGWESWPYLWNDDNTDAELTVGGDVSAVTFIDPDGETRTSQYLVPQRNQCSECHRIEQGEDVVMTPIGPKPRNLTENGQLQTWIDAGVVSGLDAASVQGAAATEGLDLDALTGEELNHAARDYLDINCAHCHRPDGVQGVTSQLFLNYENTTEFNLGVCKRPGSAGLGGGGLIYDIVPGSPDESILAFRIETEDPGAMMPLLGRSPAHNEGVDLIRAWIANMPADDCE
jgi:uncharacterized repeat protein (TIGR03806 family)